MSDPEKVPDIGAMDKATDKATDKLNEPSTNSSSNLPNILSQKKFVPLRVPVQVLAATGIRNSTASGVTQSRTGSPKFIVAQTNAGLGTKKVVTLTPQQLQQAQLKNWTSLKAVPVTSLVTTSGNKLITASGNKVVQINQGSVPNIIRSSGHGTLNLAPALAPTLAPGASSLSGNPANNKMVAKGICDEKEPMTTKELLKPLTENQGADVNDLNSSKFKCQTNELGAIEIMQEDAKINKKAEEKNEKEEEEEEGEELLMCDEDMPSSPSPFKFKDDELLCCEGCGRYGMFGDFLDPQSCSVECQQRIKEKIREKEKKERELLIQKQRRDAKKRERERERELKEAKEREERKQREKEERKKREEELSKICTSKPLSSTKSFFQLHHNMNSSCIKSSMSNSKLSLKQLQQEVINSIKKENDDKHEDESETEDKQNKIHMMKEPGGAHYNSQYPWYDSTSSLNGNFSWPRYLECTKSRSPSLKWFVSPYPRIAMAKFAVGMKLEAIDPEHPSIICVVTIAEIRGARLRLNFDGFSASYDFWEDTDSPNIFPAGFAYSKGQKLEFTPQGNNLHDGVENVPGSEEKSNSEIFDWKKYLLKTSSVVAPKECFPPKIKVVQPSSLSMWEIGAKLEAVDKANTSLVCVASVKNIIEGRVLIHFDGWENDYDYWITPHNSPYVHPVGWCQEHGLDLNPPRNYFEPGPFSWTTYLAFCNAKPVPQNGFKTVREISSFKKGMKLEVVDKRNPMLIRVATVGDVIGRQLKIHFDGWPDEYDIWLDDISPLIHPPEWCARTEHPLMAPLTPEEVQFYLNRPGCPTPGCRNLGHVQGPRFDSHAAAIFCPYSPANLNSESKLPDRLSSSSSADESKECDFGSLSRELSDEGLGRGNRRRKRRKFFDEVDDNNKNANHEDETEEEQQQQQHELIKMRKLNHEFNNVTRQQQVQLQDPSLRLDRVGIRGSVFRPGYRHDPYLGRPDHRSIAWHLNSNLLSISSDLTDSIENEKQQKEKSFDAWSPEEVANLVTQKLPFLGNQLGRKIVSEEIDGESFLLLTQNDLTQNLGLRLGPALKLYNAILSIRETTIKN